MIICISIDNVLNNLVTKALELYNKQFEKNITIDDVTSYDLYNCLAYDDAEGVLKILKSKALWDSLTPIVGAKDTLQKLIESGHRVYINTDAQSKIFDWSVQFIKRHFSFFSVDDVIRIGNKSLLKCDILIDDSLDHLIKHKYCYRVCINHPWNQQDDLRDIIYDIRRCDNWSEVIDKINIIEEEIKNICAKK